MSQIHINFISQFPHAIWRATNAAHTMRHSISIISQTPTLHSGKWNENPDVHVTLHCFHCFSHCFFFAAPWPMASSPTTRTWCCCSTWPSCSYVNLWKVIASYKSCQWICPAIMVSLIQRQPPRTISETWQGACFSCRPALRVIGNLLLPANVRVRSWGILVNGVRVGTHNWFKLGRVIVVLLHT